MVEGRLTYGTGASTTTDVRLLLAATENNYRPISRMVWPQRTDIPGRDPQDESPDVFIRRWSQNHWERGEVRGLWEDGGYRESSNVKPDREGDKLELGANRSVTQKVGPASFADGTIFGFVGSSLYAVADSTVHTWNPSTNLWSAGVSTGSAANAVSIVDQRRVNQSSRLMAFSDQTIRRYDPGAATTYEVYSATATDLWDATHDIKLATSLDVVYALEGASLYSVAEDTIGGNWTFDYTGGASEDLWTSSSVHGLNVNDALVFSTDGGGAPEYGVAVRYWVVAVPSTTTVQLSLTKSGGVLAGTADSSGNWKAEQLDQRTVISQPVDSYFVRPVQQNLSPVCATDTGVAWFYADWNGQTIIMEYNASVGTDYRSGSLPVSRVTPYSIFYAHGFIFVAYREAALKTDKGDAYIYYQRGGQKGNIGPIRNPEASTASQPIHIAGVVGDDLIFYYGKAVWAYDLSAGALFMLGASAGSAPTSVTNAIAYGKDVFIANTDGSGEVERFDTTLYTTDDASWKSGRFHFNLPGVKKTLLRVTVVHDGLAAGSQIQCKVSADGGTFSTVVGTDLVDGATSYTWVISESGGWDEQVTGYDFEIELIPDSTSSASSPQIREIFAEAIGAQKRRGVEIDIDLGSKSWGKGTSGTQLLAQLRKASEYRGGVVKFTDPWGVGEHEKPRTSDVLVEFVDTLKDQNVAQVRLWETTLVDV